MPAPKEKCLQATLRSFRWYPSMSSVLRWGLHVVRRGTSDFGTSGGQHRGAATGACAAGALLRSS